MFNKLVIVDIVIFVKGFVIKICVCFVIESFLNCLNFFCGCGECNFFWSLFRSFYSFDSVIN